MKRLVLVRHAKAARADGRVRDFDRPLSGRGQADAPAMGERLARRGVAPDAILASPAARTLATARLIARELDFPWDRIRTERRIYEAEEDELLAAVRETDGRVECLMLVAHNPGVTAFAQLLGKGFREEFTTCAVAVFDLPADTWGGVRPGTGSLLFYDSPKRGRQG